MVSCCFPFFSTKYQKMDSLNAHRQKEDKRTKNFHVCPCLVVFRWSTVVVFFFQITVFLQNVCLRRRLNSKGVPKKKKKKKKKFFKNKNLVRAYFHYKTFTQYSIQHTLYKRKQNKTIVHTCLNI